MLRLWTMLWLMWCVVLPARAEAPVARFDELAVEARDDWFVVQWSIDAATWSWIASEGRRPQLLLLVDQSEPTMAGRLAYTVSLEARSHRVLVPLPRAFEAHEVTVWLQDGADEGAVARIGVGAVAAERLTLVVLQGPRAKPLDPFARSVATVAAPPRPVQPDVAPTIKPSPKDAGVCATVDAAALVDVCGQTFLGTSAQQTCVAAAQRACVDPVPAIVACSQEVTGSEAGARCVVAASRYSLPPSPVVRACGEVLTSSHDVLACVERLADAPWAADRLVRACGQAVTGGVSTLACLDAALDAIAEPSGLVRSCGAERTGSAAVVDCVRTSVR